jgi:predicted RNase H-like nuclease (RuvC/YqgF family)
LELKIIVIVHKQERKVKMAQQNNVPHDQENDCIKFKEENINLKKKIFQLEEENINLKAELRKLKGDQRLPPTRMF